jgi:hypothetical protein
MIRPDHYGRMEVLWVLVWDNQKDEVKIFSRKVSQAESTK